jgi:predicted nucleotidyltransferase
MTGPGRALAIVVKGFMVVSLAASAGSQSVTTPEFVDVTEQAGLRWGIERVARREWNLVETMGGGGGFVDADGDGLMDIYFVSYSLEPQDAGGRVVGDALYRNNGDGTFTDVTATAGVRGGDMRGMGLASGDYDNDGDADLYISAFRGARLYRNDGGRFTDVTKLAGITGDRWGTSAAFFDSDGDGDLELFVCNYLDFDPRDRRAGFPCQMIDQTPFCSIDKFRGAPSTLYRNNGDGTFTDVSTTAGVAAHTGKGLGVVTADFDGDGAPDIFQANDTAPNFLFRNLGKGTFEEVGLEANVAFDPSGRALGAMGVDVDDVNGDGRLDVFVTNFTAQSNSLFRNESKGLFRDIAGELDLARISVPMSGFGARFFDYDNDGEVDLFVANGHPFEPVAKVWPGITWAEPAFLFQKAGNRYREVSRERGEAFRRAFSGRGVATGDYDNDGDVDLLLLCVGQPPRLFRNDGGNGRSWLGVRLVGTRSNRDAVGARVVVSAGGRTATRTIAGGTSYCSASDRRIVFGLGDLARVDRVEVMWPSGTTDRLEGIEARQYVTIREGSTRKEVPAAQPIRRGQPLRHW